MNPRNIDRQLITLGIELADVSRLVHQGKLNAKDDQGETALIRAVNLQQDSLVEALVKAGADLDLTNNAGKTALEVAIEGEHFPAAYILLGAGASIRDLSQLYILLKSEDRSDVQVLLRLEKMCEDFEALAEEQGHSKRELEEDAGYQEFLALCKKQHMSWLLKKESNFKDYETAKKIIKFMVKHHVSLDSQDSEGFTALDRAIQMKHFEIIYVLIHHGATIRDPRKLFDYLKTCSQTDANGLDILRKLCDQQHQFKEDKQNAPNSLILSEETYKEIIDFCINSHVKWFREYIISDKYILHKYMEGKHAEEKEMIGNLKNAKWLSAKQKLFFNKIFIEAVCNASKEFVQLLIDAGASVDAQDKLGNTVLMKAARKGADEQVKLLLAAGANLEIVTGDKTALDMAIQERNLSTVNLLLRHGAKIRNPQAFFEFLKAYPIPETFDYRVLEALRELCKQQEIHQKGLVYDVTVEAYQSMIEYCNMLHLRELHRAAKWLQPMPSFSRYALRYNLSHDKIPDSEIKNIIHYLKKAKKLDDKDHDNGCTALISSAHLDKDDMVRDLIEAKASSDVTDNNGDSALIVAAREGHSTIVEQLLAAARRDLRNNENKTAFDVAVQRRQFSTIELFLRHNEEIRDPRALYNILKSDEILPITELVIFRDLCQQQARYQEKGKELKESPLFFSTAEYKHVVKDCVNQHDSWLGNIINSGKILTQYDKHNIKIILEWLSEQGYDGSLRLIDAAREGRDEIVSMLLASHATPDKVDQSGQSALSCAANRGFDKIVERLIAAEEIKLEQKNAALVEALRGFYAKYDKAWAAAIQKSNVKSNEVEKRVTEETGDKFLSIVCMLLRSGAMILNPQFLREFLEKFNQSDPRVLYAFEILCKQQKACRELPETKEEGYRLEEKGYQKVVEYHGKLAELAGRSEALVTGAIHGQTSLPRVLVNTVKEYCAESTMECAFSSTLPVFFKPADIEKLHDKEFAPKVAPAVRPS